MIPFFLFKCGLLQVQLEVTTKLETRILATCVMIHIYMTIKFLAFCIFLLEYVVDSPHFGQNSPYHKRVSKTVQPNINL